MGFVNIVNFTRQTTFKTDLLMIFFEKFLGISHHLYRHFSSMYSMMPLCLYFFCGTKDWSDLHLLFRPFTEIFRYARNTTRTTALTDADAPFNLGICVFTCVLYI